MSSIYRTFSGIVDPGIYGLTVDQQHYMELFLLIRKLGIKYDPTR